jgi:AcrR family transcriptional regulator
MTQETTKDNILTVAVTVFAEKSYRQATVAEICKRAERKYPIRHLACHQPR